MRGELARIAGDLEKTLRAETEQAGAGHILVPPAAPRIAAPAEVLGRIETAVRACTRCQLCRTRKNAVPGEGSAEAPVMFIGEAPGADEDRQGRPFVGRAGELLTKMLLAIGVRREEVFIGNVLKCRPPRNRDPLPDEAAMCRRYLMAQIAAIRPAFIVALGRISAQLLLETSEGITRMRGNFRPFRYEGGVAEVLPTFHPAYLLRNPPAKREAWEDLKLLHRRLREQTGDWPPPLPRKEGSRKDA